MTQFDTTLFKGIVRNVAYKYAAKVNKALYSFEDVEQELWEKLYTVYQNPKDPFKNLPQVEQIKSAKVFLSNRMKDILRARFRCIDEKVVPCDIREDNGADPNARLLDNFAYTVGQSSSDIILRLANSEGAGFKAIVDQMSENFYSVEKDFLYTELRGLIFQWIATQNGPVKRIMTEKLTPSKEIVDKWDDLCNKYPRYKGYESIPGTTLCDLLNIERKWWYQGLRDLKDFLQFKGYGVAV